MTYTPQTWINQNAATPVNATRMTHIEDGIANAYGAAAALTGATAATRYVGGTTSGAPATGAFLKGDFAIDQTGTIWICTTAGSPGTWSQVTGGGGGSGSPTGAASGDLTGNYPGPLIANSAVTNAKVSNTAAIAASKIAGTAVTQADTGTVTSTMLAGSIAPSKVTGTAVTQADTGTVTSAMLAGSIAPSKVTGTAVTQGDTGTVTSAMIANGAILDTDINASAAIAVSKLAAGTNGQVLTTSGSTVAWGSAGGGGGGVTSVVWTALTAYIAGQLVSHDPGSGPILYQVATNFTSGASFNTTNLTQIAVTPGAVLLTGSVPFSQPGSAATGASGVWTAPASGTLVRIRLSCMTLPVGSNLVVQFLLNGSQVTNSPLTVTTGALGSAPFIATPQNPNAAFLAGDTFNVNATSVGSSTAATGVVAQIDYQQVVA